MANFGKYEAEAKGWATGHLIVAALIAAAVGFVLGIIVG